MPPSRSAARARARTRGRRRIPVWMWWVLGGVLVVAVVAGFLFNRSSSTAENAKVVKPASAVGPNGGVLVGDPSAPVTITEFGDFQCPVCRELQQLWEPTLAQLIQQGKVKFEFVGLQFLDFYNALYDGQSREENSGFLTNDQLLKFGRSVGLTDSTFTNCVKSGRYTGLIAKNTDATTGRGITTTPTVLLNGKQISNSVAADPQRLTDAVNQAGGQG